MKHIAGATGESELPDSMRAETKMCWRNRQLSAKLNQLLQFTDPVRENAIAVAMPEWPWKKCGVFVHEAERWVKMQIKLPPGRQSRRQSEA